MGWAQVQLDPGLRKVSLGLTASLGWALLPLRWLLPQVEHPVAPGLTHQRGHPLGKVLG